MTLGERVAFLMKKNNLKGEEFARIFNKSASNISSILNDKTKPSPEFAIEICEYFGCTLDWFWTGKGNYNVEEQNTALQELQNNVLEKPTEIYKKYVDLLERHNKMLQEKIDDKEESIRVKAQP